MHMASKVPVVWGKPKRRIRFDRRDYKGYWLDGEFYPGYPDNPELSDRERLAIARWAEDWNPETMSPAQKQLIADNPPSVSRGQKEWNANYTELEAPYMRTLWDSLSEEEQEIVRKPATSSNLSKTRYPLTVAELAAATGASEDEIHRWTDEGLLPAFRERDDRRFYSAALIRAFGLRRAPDQIKPLAAPSS
jgi:hypothetical protein